MPIAAKVSFEPRLIDAAVCIDDRFRASVIISQTQVGLSYLVLIQDCLAAFGLASVRILNNNQDPRMTQHIAAFCYSVFFLLALASPFMPMFLMWRMAGLSAAAYATGNLIEGPVHWSDQNFGYTIGIAIAFLFSCAVALAILIRFLVSVIRETLSVDAMIGPKNRFMFYFDIAALAAIGCSAGLFLTISLAYVLSGSSSDMNLDLGIATLAIAITAVVFILSRKKFAITIACMFATLAVSALLGARQPNQILTTAAALAEGQAWCLTTSDGAISRVRQLGFFTLPKGNSNPHLGLLIRGGDQTVMVAHWSIRQQEFVEGTRTSGSVPACYPIANFAEALENGNVKNDI